MLLADSKKHLSVCVCVCVCQGEIYSYVHNLLSMPGYSPGEKQTVKDKVLQHIQVSKYTDRHTHGYSFISGLVTVVAGQIGRRSFSLRWDM